MSSSTPCCRELTDLLADCDINEQVFLTFSILGGLTVPFLRSMPWAKSADALVAIWGYCPRISEDVPSPARFCHPLQRPCAADEHQLAGKLELEYL
ncbi:uncharacterized protein SPPG_09472 [Spizellomyces punctatus DAOM BR117]|uniref:Uncharacterized protein n=1 Tax=Spizellomyces punctatus (strain DAOM BR117) TaxID=645134 RepID=A0A0L0H6J0_SPIPD|nr:uncharacterized protein SPPG_09472 [Spizellomyces punctatus DAOM BR117]KNC97090.1 hypothetical protein SPPG_09472 [Spizellomyces punctatus DAOM BR117]|eukprot:XP_016605130.1 hypothetical protein SPPG_09472 [Spizellomyces punctatus DAOM BR117]